MHIIIMQLSVFDFVYKEELITHVLVYINFLELKIKTCMTLIVQITMARLIASYLQVCVADSVGHIC